MTNKESINRITLYLEALKYLGSDASPMDEAIDDLGCADSVSKIIINTFGNIIPGSVSTRILNEQLNKSKHFTRVKDFRPGDIIMSPTGSSKGGKISNGHVGIVGENEQIMSNSSSTGLWTQNFTIASWVERYRMAGGYPIICYRKN